MEVDFWLFLRSAFGLSLEYYSVFHRQRLVVAAWTHPSRCSILKGPCTKHMSKSKALDKSVSLHTPLHKLLELQGT